MSDKKIKCIITDDEPFARDGLQDYVKKINFLQLVAVCEDPLQLSSVLREQPADLLFLDIEMPYLTGVEFLMTNPDPPKVIFATAFENYALRGFELDVLDYLLKPISFNRFVKACNKAHDFFLSKEENQPAYFFVKTDHKLEKLVYEDILFAEAKENYVAIYTSVKKMMIHSTLRAVQQNLPVNQFIQTHKSYLVNMGRVSAIEGNILHVDGYQVPVSKSLKAEVLEKILNKRIL
ncbi:MAG: LytTR family transcriptional regulator DNA-binding domain-containing protein [Bacteroidota bacterium]|nr:LytTR family transcriptional regulator DNA-binding domain-containing protein [Bacteroidota bacterium]